MAAAVPTGSEVPHDSAVVAQTRLRFLTAQEVLGGAVRASILASWRRSREMQVAADQVIQQYRGEHDADTPLTRAAEPVLRNLRTQLDGQPMSIILTDPTGTVLSRQTGDAELNRHLDRMLLAPGFCYAERFVGTNGIGTALEVGGPTHVFGHEHYAENLENLACAAVPIRHPISGRTVGAVDLTCWERDAGPLLLTLAKSTAEQIRQALLAGVGVQQTALLHEYLRTCRRSSDLVLAVSGDLVMINDRARAVLDPVDQAALVERVAATPQQVRRQPVDVVLPSGSEVRLYARLLPHSAAEHAVVAHARVLPGHDERGAHAAPSRPPLPGLAGHAPVWVRTCEEAEAARHAGQWLALEGEAGVGKLSLARAVQQAYRPAGHLLVLDAALHEEGDGSWEAVLAEMLHQVDAGVVVQHVDRASDARLLELGEALGSLAAGPDGTRRGPWVAVTLAEAAERPALAEVLAHFPTTVQVPPLRRHVDDIEQLVPVLLGRLVRADALRCSPEALQVLARAAWPGNTGQLMDVLRQVVKHRRAGVVEVADLPPEVKAVTRRRLSRLESLERDAVVQCLADAGGDKTKAAAALGVSRATIYRKIHEYGIVEPPH